MKKKKRRDRVFYYVTHSESEIIYAIQDKHILMGSCVTMTMTMTAMCGSMGELGEGGRRVIFHEEYEYDTLHKLFYFEF